MCGIAGYIADAPTSTLSSAVRAMTDSLARRGPDSAGLELWPGAALGHRRLAILDLSEAGHQPMLSSDGHIGVVFNGCIYNFREIRKELEQFGCRFTSNTDTEIIVHGYRQWGVDALVARMRGMFAIGIWDNLQRRLILIRDRLGVKPLVWVERNNSIAFASTVTALRDAGLAPDRLNSSAVLEFLEFGWVSDDHAIYEGVQKQAPGTILEWSNGRCSQRSFWQLPEPGSRKISFADAVDEAEELLLEAARIRLVSDVPVGTLLSGGIDSALVCWAMSRAGADIRSFTVGTPGHQGDESAQARRTAELLGIPHEVIEVEPEQKPLLDDISAAYGEPFACTSAVGMLQVCHAVRDRVTVLLTGDGGDDVFLGYPHQLRLWYAQKMRRFVPGFLAPAWKSLEPIAMRSTPLRRAWRMVDYGLGGLGAVTAANNGLPWFEQHQLLGERLGSLRLSHRSIPRSPESGHNLVRDYFNYERRYRFVAEYLTKVDGASMYWGVEARSPFLDQKLWEFAAALPINVRLHGGELKAVLRAIVRRRVGPEVAERRKSGFNIPVERWLSGIWSEELQTLNSNSLLEREGWLRKGSVTRTVQQSESDHQRPLQLWYMLVLERWLRLDRGRRHVQPQAVR